jgi:hypothetical protein
MAGAPISDNLPFGGSAGGESVGVSLRSSDRECLFNPAVDAAAANEPVADHPDVISLQRRAPAPQPHRGDAERMEHERQSRLKRWQAART